MTAEKWGFLMRNSPQLTQTHWESTVNMNKGCRLSQAATCHLCAYAILHDLQLHADLTILHRVSISLNAQREPAVGRMNPDSSLNVWMWRLSTDQPNITWRSWFLRNECGKQVLPWRKRILDILKRWHGARSSDISHNLTKIRKWSW